MTQESIEALSTWLTTPAGRYVVAWEQSCFDKMTRDIFGFNALQLGVPMIQTLRANRILHQWLVNIHSPLPDADGHNFVVIRAFEELPFATQSIDLIVLPHILEFVQEPHQVLREVERVLIPEGHLIICGLNPASLWGVRHTIGRWFGRYFFPPSTAFISLLRLKDWLKLLNMEVNQGCFGCYALPSLSERGLSRFAFLEKAGNRWWSYCGAVYVIEAIKRVSGVTWVGPALVNKSVAAPGAIGVAGRAGSTNKWEKDKRDENRNLC